MDPRFNDIFSNPANDIFHVVFFPDRIYHAQYLNATRSTRYRYDVQEVRAKCDALLMKGDVYLDDQFLTQFIRVEYRSARLTEQSRLKSRLLREEIVAWVKLMPEGAGPAESRVRLTFCPWVDAYQCEVWASLEPPPGIRHDIKVLDMMGREGAITRISSFSPVLRDLKKLRRVELAFREDNFDRPFGYPINDANAGWDNFYGRNVQVPNFDNPSDGRNTVKVENYQIDFQRGFFIGNVRDDVKPVKYRNAMMASNELQTFADLFFGGDRAAMDAKNITSMRWIFQQELGSDLVFFHEVEIPPGGVEGTHQHIGSEELYFITEGEGLAYMAENDDPALAAAPGVKTVQLPIFGLDQRKMKEVPVKPGSVIFTKSGGMHGIRNPGATPLRFVAFLYHAQ